jgi:D-aspartate ligase
VRVPTARSRGLVNALTNLSRRIGEPSVLVLTEDRDVEVVSSFREELEHAFRFSLPSKEMVHTLADKTLFQKLAETEGLPVPRTAVLKGIQDLHLLEALTPPFVIKPDNFQLVSDRGITRAMRVDTVGQARAVAVNLLKSVCGIVVQEWIEGADSDIFFTLFTCDANSNIKGLFSGRKVTCHPPELGSTAICSAAGETGDELAELSRKFVRQVGYKGLGSLEFKRHRKTGKFLIIEPTVGRTDWQEEIATLCGVNIPLIAYWAELGCTFSRAPAEPVPLAWRSSVEYRPPLGLLPPGTRIVDGHFRLADPLPGLYHYGIERFLQPIRLRAERGIRSVARFATSGNQHSVARTKSTSDN